MLNRISRGSDTELEVLTPGAIEVVFPVKPIETSHTQYHSCRWAMEGYLEFEMAIH